MKTLNTSFIDANFTLLYSNPTVLSEKKTYPSQLSVALAQNLICLMRQMLTWNLELSLNTKTVIFH